MVGSGFGSIFFVLLVFVALPVNARNIANLLPTTDNKQPQFTARDGFGGHNTVKVAGSRLPDCSHACGSCSPCRLVVVSYVCSSIEEAESCPMSYKCMCHNKSYPVP